MITSSHLCCTIYLYSVLRKNCGRCQNTELALDLVSNESKSGSGQGVTVGSLHLKLDGIR